MNLILKTPQQMLDIIELELLRGLDVVGVITAADIIAVFDDAQEALARQSRFWGED